LELESGGPAEQAGLKADDLIVRVNDTPVHNQNDMAPVLQKLAAGSKVTFVVDRAGQQQTIDVTLGKRPPAGQRRYEKFGTIPETLPGPNPGGGLGPEGSGAEPGRLPTDAVPGNTPNRPPLNGARAGDSGVGGAPNPAIPETQPFRLGSNGLPGAEPVHRALLGVRTRPVSEAAQQRLHLPSTNGALVVSRTVGSPATLAGIPLDAVITAVDGKPVLAPVDLTQLIVQAGAGHEVEITYLFGGSEQRAKVKLAEFVSGPSGLVGGGAANAGAVPLPPPPQGRLPMADDKTRIGALERRVQQLEHRVDDLEQALNKAR
jgi:membrane-associated protease RseP (regulator of RpoE activity)